MGVYSYDINVVQILLSGDKKVTKKYVLQVEKNLSKVKAIKSLACRKSKRFKKEQLKIVRIKEGKKYLHKRR